MLELVPDDVVELGDEVLLDVLGDVLLDELGDVLLELGDVVLMLELDDGLVLVSLDELGGMLLVLGDVLVPVPLELDVPAPDVVPAPVAPVPDVPDIEPELLALVSDEPEVLEPCDEVAPVELESELLVPVPLVCADAMAAIAAIATAVKVFGSLLMGSPVAE